MNKDNIFFDLNKPVEYNFNLYQKACTEASEKEIYRLKLLYDQYTKSYNMHKKEKHTDGEEGTEIEFGVV